MTSEMLRVFSLAED